MAGLGRIMVVLGLALVGVGAVVVLLARWNVPLGRLPGDMLWRGRGWTVSFPLMTCVVLSVVVSVLLWVVGWLRR